MSVIPWYIKPFPSHPHFEKGGGKQQGLFHLLKGKVERSLVENFGENWPTKPLLVSLSGGMDSMLLLKILHALQANVVAIGHVNFGLRGEDSEEDETLCHETAKVLGLPFQVKRVDLSGNKVGIQVAARNARLAAYDEWLGVLPLKTLVVLAHHADDQAETLLMRLGRGSGLIGLAGMKPLSGRLLRPMLGITKAEILQVVNAVGLIYREDRSNATHNYTRNRLRHNALPALSEALGKSAVNGMRASSVLLAETRDWLNQSLTTLEQEAVAHQKINRQLDNDLLPLLTIERKWLVGQPHLRLVLQHLLAPYSIKPDDIEDLRGRLLDGETAYFHQSNRAGKSYAVGLSSTLLEVNLLPPQPSIKVVEIPKIEAAYELGNGWVLNASIDVPTTPEANPWTAMIDCDTVQWPLKLRPVNSEEDEIEPLGLPNRHKRLTDLMREAKWPRSRREATLVLVDASGKVIWVPGLRLAHRPRLTESTKEMATIALTFAKQTSVGG